MRKTFLLLTIGLLLASCQNLEPVDLLITHAKIYTVDEDFSVTQAIAIKDGKIVATGTRDALARTYEPKERIRANGKFIYPGFIDAHAHLYGMGLSMQEVDLSGAKSYAEVVERTRKFNEENPTDYISGRGWDQNLWEDKNFPSKEALDEVFPDTPVVLTRVDGHALLANSAAMRLADFDENTKIDGGQILWKDGEPTGVFIDAAMGLIRKHKPAPSRQDQIRALQLAQEKVFSYGLTTINDAGLQKEVILLIDSLQKENNYPLRIYAMISSSDPESLDYFLDQGIYKTDGLSVRSAKVFTDGALGSRGAALREPYSDDPHNYGLTLISKEDFTKLSKRLADANFQMNSHAIGDSANHVVLTVYKEALKDKTDARWKVEHAQILSPEHFAYFSDNIIASVQPTHATSDMPWAESRLGADRIKGAYAYQDILRHGKRLALGTDFPVEKVNPMYTFYSAVARQDHDGNPAGGFMPEQRLTREQTLRGMTIWAAYSNFEEEEKGSLEAGKFADFIMMDEDLMEVDISEIPNIKVQETYIGGKRVYKK